MVGGCCNGSPRSYLWYSNDGLNVWYMRSESMIRARAYLVRKYGESFGQTMWAWQLQRWGLTAEDEVCEGMKKEVYN